MNALRGVAGLFFDDGSLAIVVLAILASAAIVVNALGESAAMIFLVGSVIAALLENVLRTARAKD
jgi:hypothetical protein